jgi:lysyl endopeptidase
MKKTAVLLSILFSVCCISEIAAQLNQGGTPVSFTYTDKAKLSDVPFMTMPFVDVEALRREDVYNDQLKDQPWRFGQDLFVSYNPENSGTWDMLKDRSRIWRLGIASPGALSINMTFDRFKLPEGATLFVYSADHSMILGAFTSLNNQADGYFATELIEDESVIIEYYEPADAEFSGELNLWRVTHGYRSISDYLKDFEDSGTCNVNAACSQGDPIRSQIRSVARIVVGGGLCSGALINNTNNNGTPYFLTAYHCYGTAGSVVFRFNWQSPTCSNPASSPSYQSLSGAVDKAYYANSDFWLMQLNQTPPADYNVYYSGWNREVLSTIAGKVWCIHHPAGDIKKISWANGGVTTTSYLDNGAGTNHWKVSSWSDGTTTEGGSSGSPLYDPQLRIIGQLHGGYAACGNTLADYYGKLSTSWTGGGTNTTRLSNWLDPTGSGVNFLNGYDPNAAQYAIDGEMSSVTAPVESYGAEGTIVPSVVIKNSGTSALTAAVIYYKLDDVDSVGINWTGNLLSGATATVTFPDMPLTIGYHQFLTEIVVDGDENPANNNAVVDFIVTDCESPSLPFADGFDGASFSPCWTTSVVSGTSGSLSLVSAGTSPVCTPSQGTRMIEFNSGASAIGASVRLQSPALETSGMEDITVSFDWYHNNTYSGAADKVIVQYSTDGLQWSNVSEILRYSASLSGWNNKSVVLPEAADNRSAVYIGLQYISAHGNNCHLDNLEITATDITGAYPDFLASDVSIVIDETVTFTDHSVNGPFTTYDWNFGEGANPATATGAGPHNVIYETAGMKTVSLTLDDTYTKTKENYITVGDGIPGDPFNLMAAVRNNDVFLAWDVNDAFSDGFESGDFSAWADMIEGPGTIGEDGYPYWYVLHDETSAYEGEYVGKTDWGYNLDTWLIAPNVEIKNNSKLVFVWSSSYYWNVDPYDNGDLFVKISTDNGDKWETLWTFGEIGEWESWAWYETTIELNDYAGSFASIAFNLTGNDNSEAFIDSIFLEDDGAKRLPGTRLIRRMDGDPVSRTFHSHNGVITPYSSLKIASMIDYSIFRDDTEITQSEVKSYTDSNVPNGTYTYYVIGNYTNPDGSTGPSNSVTVIVDYDYINTPDFRDIALLYPNPSDGLFYLSIVKGYTVTVTNLNGSVLKKLQVNATTELIDLSDQKEGLYLLHFRSDETNFVLKVMIQ